MRVAPDVLVQVFKCRAAIAEKDLWGRPLARHPNRVSQVPQGQPAIRSPLFFLVAIDMLAIHGFSQLIKPPAAVIGQRPEGEPNVRIRSMRPRAT